MNYQIEAEEINATISVDGNVTFSDLTTTVTKEQIDEALKNAQVQGKLLLELERTLTSSKEYLNKVIWSIFAPPPDHELTRYPFIGFEAEGQ